MKSEKRGMSRLLIVLRLLIFAGALGSAMTIHARPETHGAGLTWISEESAWSSGRLPIDGHEVVKVVLTAVSLSLL